MGSPLRSTALDDKASSSVQSPNQLIKSRLYILDLTLIASALSLFVNLKI
nr:MAG TPA: hypothetical protein [Caudoviricetes sp.]